MIERTSDPVKRAKREAEFAMPPFPLPLQYLWNWYLRLRSRKGGAGFSVSPIEYPDINSFQNVTHINLIPWELQAIERLDDIFLSAMNTTKPE